VVAVLKLCCNAVNSSAVLVLLVRHPLGEDDSAAFIHPVATTRAPVL
jgi:hypothetical protein